MLTRNDKDSDLIRILKGVRGISPNIDSAACGECREKLERWNGEGADHYARRTSSRFCLRQNHLFGYADSPNNKYVFAGMRLKLVRVACGCTR